MTVRKPKLWERTASRPELNLRRQRRTLITHPPAPTHRAPRCDRRALRSDCDWPGT